MGTTWLELLIAGLLATLKFSIVVPAFILKEKLTFFESLIFGVSAGTFGIIFFMYLSSGILAFWEWIKLKTGVFKNKKPKKKFTKTNRRWVKVKLRYGLAGIAFLTPILISIPIGCYIAMRYYKNKKQVFLYMFISVIIWSLIFSSFGSTIHKIFNAFTFV